MSDLAIDIEEVLRDIHSREPRPSWEAAVEEACAHEYTGRNGTFNLISDEDGDDGAAQIEGVMETMIGRAWDDVWSDEENDGEEDDDEADGAVADFVELAHWAVQLGVCTDGEIDALRDEMARGARTEGEVARELQALVVPAIGAHVAAGNSVQGMGHPPSLSPEQRLRNLFEQEQRTLDEQGRAVRSDFEAPPDSRSTLTVRPHPAWPWDPAPGAPVRFHSLVARPELNGCRGKLLTWDGSAGRWSVRCEGEGGEGIRVKPSNFTLGTQFTVEVAADGSTPVRVVRDQAAAKVGGTYLPSQFSLWLGSKRLEEDTFDSDSIVTNRCLHEYGIGSRAGQAPRRAGQAPVVLELLLAARTPGVPAELDPTSEYSRVRVFPEGMAYEEKVRRHEELFGKHGRYEGPPYHPDVTPMSSFSLPIG